MENNMSDFSVRDLVDFTLANQPVKAREAFDSVFLDKLKDAIEDKKIDVAAKFFNSAQQVDTTETEEQDNG
jgi:hypothetical protein